MGGYKRRRTGGFRTIGSQDILVNKKALNTDYLKKKKAVCIFGASKNVRMVKAL